MDDINDSQPEVEEKCSEENLSSPTTNQYQPLPAKPKQKGILSIISSIFGGFLMAIGLGVVGCFLLLCLLVYSVSNNATKFKFPKQGKLGEVVVTAGSKNKILVINLTGIILGDGSYVSSEGSIKPLIKQFRYAAKEPSIKAVILQVSSGGGGLTASDILYNEVKHLQKSGKKVTVSIGAMAASGAYYTIAPADYIVISPTGMAGSFGVIMNRMNFKELMKKVGIAAEPIKSTTMKDMGSPFRDLTEEEKAYFQKIIKTYHQRFVNIISKGRKIPELRVKELANGKLYTAEESVAYNLVDSIGYFDTALEQAKKIAKLKNPTIITYNEKYPWMKLLNFKTSSAIDEKKLAGAIFKQLIKYSNKVEIDAK